METEKLLQLNNDILQTILDVKRFSLPKILVLTIKGQIMANKDKIKELRER